MRKIDIYCSLLQYNEDLRAYKGMTDEALSGLVEHAQERAKEWVATEDFAAIDDTITMLLELLLEKEYRAKHADD